MKVKVKRSGTLFIGATVFLGVAAANTGNNLLYIVVSAMLSLMLVSGIASIVNIRGLEVRVIPPAEVFAGVRVTFRILVRRRTPLTSFLIKVSSGIDWVLFPSVGKDWEEGRLGFIFDRRGEVRKVQVEISSDFPLGMFVRSVAVPVKAEFVVFPKREPASLRLKSSGSGKEEGLTGSAYVKGYDELRGVRKYSGEPMKLVHWKLTAKRGEIMVKDTVAQEREPIVLSLEDVEGDIETKLSRLTYLTLKLMEEGYPVGLKLNGKEIPPGRGEKQKLLILRELALY